MSVLSQHLPLQLALAAAAYDDAARGCSLATMSAGTSSSSPGSQLNSGGSALPLGSSVAGSRSSSKKGCVIAWYALYRFCGAYCSSRDTYNSKTMQFSDNTPVLDSASWQHGNQRTRDQMTRLPMALQHMS